MSKSPLTSMFQLLKSPLINELYVSYFLVLESKKLAKYNAALKKSTAISFDEDLSFLDSFITKAKLNGAK